MPENAASLEVNLHPSGARPGYFCLLDVIGRHDRLALGVGRDGLAFGCDENLSGRGNRGIAPALDHNGVELAAGVRAP